MRFRPVATAVPTATPVPTATAVPIMAVCAVVALLLAGCASGAENDPPQATGAAPPTVTATATESSDRSDDSLIVDVRVDGGTVVPTNERIDASVGEPITVRIDSDTVDELHVHSVPDHTFEVAAAPEQRFEFVVDVPGQVALELHDAGVTIAVLQVRP